MALDGKILRRAIDALERENQDRAERTARLRASLYEKDPEIERLDAQLQTAFAEAATLALSGGDPAAAMAAAEARNLRQQEERRHRITALGYPADCIDDLPACPVCGDRGFVGTKPCSCLLRHYAEQQRQELSRMLDLQGQSFDTFRLSWYDAAPNPETGVSPREHMELVELSCRRYAETFSAGSGNLFLSGAPGLGKTFLSACIAREVAKRGFSVVYDTAVNLIGRYEEAHFGRGGETEQEAARADVRRYQTCDLLILDDLGTEMITAFSISALYETLNTRLTENRSTVISSNLSVEEIGRKYSQQIASRIAGCYENLRFYGKDIRQLKKAEAQRYY